MFRPVLQPDEKLLEHVRSYRALATFYATDRRLVRVDWRPFAPKPVDLPYESILSIDFKKKRFLSTIAVGVLMTAVAFSVPGLLARQETINGQQTFILDTAAYPAVLQVLLLFSFVSFYIGPLLIVIGVLRKTPVWQIKDARGSLLEISGKAGKRLAETVKKQSAQKESAESWLEPISLLPERPTRFESLVGALRLPYTVGCLTVALVYITLLFSYDALFTSTLPSFQVGLIRVFSGAWVFLFLYMINQMRLKVASAHVELSQLYDEETFHRAFALLSRARPAILLGIVLTLGLDLLEVSLTPDVIPSGPIGGSGEFFLWLLAYLGLGVFSLVFFVLGIGTFVWVYVASLRGLHNLGKETPNLKHFTEDRMLGARVFGSLSLSLAFSYLVPLGILIVVAMVSTKLLDVARLAIFLILGGVMFFLPLRNIHRRMLGTKLSEQASVRRQLLELSARPKTQDAQDWLAEFQRLQITKQEVDSIHTWPFDTPILGRFALVVTSAASGLIVQFILIALRAVGILPK